MINKKIFNIIKEMAFFSIYGLLRGIYAIINLCSVRNNRIFVNCFDGKGYGDNPKYIINELLNIDNQFEIYWLNSDINEKVPFSQIRYIKPMTIQAIYYQASSKFWVSTVRMPYYSKKKSTQIYFHTWHAGLALKKVERECENSLSSRYIRTAKHDSKMIDFYISSNKDNTFLFKNYFWYKGGEVLEIGSPRNDIFFNSSEITMFQLKQKYGLGNSKVVTYAPTFRKDGALSAYSIDFIKLMGALRQKFGGDWKVLVRLHPRLANKSRQFVKYGEYIVDGSGISDAQEVLLMSDILITDYSSISTDFLLTRRPVFIYAADIDDYVKDRDFHVRLEDLPFDVAASNKELNEFVIGFDEAAYLEKLEIFIKKYGYFDDGKASIKIAKMIASMRKEDRL